MTADELRKLQRLLGGLYPGAKELRNKDLWQAWLQALAHVPYEKAKDNAIAHALKSPYFPKVCDIAKGAEKNNSWVEQYIK